MTRAWLLATPLLLGSGEPPADALVPAASRDRPANLSETQIVPFVAVATPEARVAAGSAELPVDDHVLRRCTPDRAWCAELAPDREGWRLDIVGNAGAAMLEQRVSLPLPREEADDPSYALWTGLVGEPGGAVMVGLLASRRASFSGGGAMATRLTLLRLESGASAAVAVLDVPIEGSATIRACFSEEDVRDRREACHDEYKLSSALVLASPDQARRHRPRARPADGSQSASFGRPTFLYTAAARTYPGQVRRWDDSAERPPLTARDLVWADDADCSYRRIYSFDPALGHYVPDGPLPDCSAYLVAEDQ